MALTVGQTKEPGHAGGFEEVRSIRNRFGKPVGPGHFFAFGFEFEAAPLEGPPTAPVLHGIEEDAQGHERHREEQQGTDPWEPVVGPGGRGAGILRMHE